MDSLPKTCPFRSDKGGHLHEQQRDASGAHPENCQKMTSSPSMNGKKESPAPYYCTSHHLSSEEVMKMEGEYAAHNYHPLPCVISRGAGVHVWDPEGKQYFDFLSAYSAVNQGHCHPKILAAMVDQAQTCTLSSRAFYNDVFPRFAKYITEYFGFEMVLPMNTGAEGVETALKLARRWGYVKKGIPDCQAVILCCSENFHGRTLSIISMSTDPSAKDGFGPYMPNLRVIPYNDLNALKTVLEEIGTHVAGFLVEPIQGEAGVVVPDEGYLKKAYELCKKHKVLFIADEIQTGLCRTGRLLACDWEDFKPDVLILGKALSGGFLPISAVLSSREIMLTIKPGEHGSTFGGNPLAAAVGIAALEVLKTEKLAERAFALGEKLRAELNKMRAVCPFIQCVRGKGLLNAIVIDPKFTVSAWDICLEFKNHGLLAKPTHGNIIRLAPPLVMTEEQLDACVQILRTVLTKVASSGQKQ